MADAYGPFGLSYEDEKQRLHNLALCRRFLEINGPTRNVERTEFVTDTGTMVLTFASGGDPREAKPLEFSFKQLGEMSAAGKFPDPWRYWRMSNGTIYTTPDPNLMFIECDGQSVLYEPRCHGELGYYLNHYILTMTFVDGKLDNVYEFYNPAAVFHNFGWHREPRMF